MSKAQPLGNAEPVQDLREIDAARTALGRIGIDDRFGGEESAFQRIHGADVRFWGAGAHCIGARQVDDAARSNPALAPKLVERSARQHHDVRGLAFLDALPGLAIRL